MWSPGWKLQLETRLLYDMKLKSSAEALGEVLKARPHVIRGRPQLLEDLEDGVDLGVAPEERLASTFLRYYKNIYTIMQYNPIYNM